MIKIVAIVILNINAYKILGVIYPTHYVVNVTQIILAVSKTKTK